MLILSSKFIHGFLLSSSALRNPFPIMAGTGHFTGPWEKLVRMLAAGGGWLRGSLCAGPHLATARERDRYMGKLWYPGQNETFLLWFSSHSTIWLPN